MDHKTVEPEIAAQSAPAEGCEAVEVPEGRGIQRVFNPDGYVIQMPDGGVLRITDFGGGGVETAFAKFVRAVLTAAPATPAAREATGRWIPVSERLPSVAQEVIVDSESDGITAGFLDSYGEWYAPNSDYKLTRVVAWQPLPDAPSLAAHRKQAPSY